MGFNLGAAITGALGGSLAGLGTLGTIASGVGLGFAGGSSGGGSRAATTSFQTVPETEQEQIARAGIFDIATGELPAVPRREIAPAGAPGPERKLARETATQLAQPVDILSLPEVQAIIQETTAKGNLLANRIGRALQATGNISSTTGRDVLGRAVTDVQKSITASLAPFAVEERARRERLIPTLETLGLTEEERQRGVTQAEKDAEFQRQLGEFQVATKLRPDLLASIFGIQPTVQPVIQGQQSSSIAEFAPLIGPLLSSFLKS